MKTVASSYQRFKAFEIAAFSKKVVRFFQGENEKILLHGSRGRRPWCIEHEQY